MDLAKKIINLKPGSAELDQLRKSAISGNADALRTYVYFCAWQGIRADSFVPADKKEDLFRDLVKADLIEVSLG